MGQHASFTRRRGRLGVEVRRGEVYLAHFGPSLGSEVAKVRPCVVVSPDEVNRRAATFIGVPLTSKRRPYPYRVDCEFQERSGQVMLDQIQVMSPLRITSKLGRLNPSELTLVLDRLAEMFAP